MGEEKKAVCSAKRTKEWSRDPPTPGVPSGAEEETKAKGGDKHPDREVRVELQGSELWKRFYEIGTEMIITKAGRCGQVTHSISFISVYFCCK